MHFRMFHKVKYCSFPGKCHDSFCSEAEDVEDAYDRRVVELPAGEYFCNPKIGHLPPNDTQLKRMF